MRYFDLYHGVELQPVKNQVGRVQLTFTIEAQGYGALLAIPGAPDAEVQSLTSRMKEMSATPLSTYSHEWETLPQQIGPIVATKPPSGSPTDMVKIPEGDLQLSRGGH